MNEAEHELGTLQGRAGRSGEALTFFDKQRDQRHAPDLQSE